MKRKQLNIRIPRSHLDRINELRGDLTQSEFIMRLIDEEWGRKKKMDTLEITHMNVELLEEYAVGIDGIVKYAVAYDRSPDIRFCGVSGGQCIDHIMRGKPLPDGSEEYDHAQFTAHVRAARLTAGSTFEKIQGDFRREFPRRKDDISWAREYYP